MKQLIKILLVLSLGSSTLFSQEVKDGSLSVLVFSNGKPLIANEIKVDGKRTLRTDSDGAIQTRLLPGSHQVEIFGKDAAGVSLGYFKKQVRVEVGKDTQVIATLSKTGADTIDIDLPVKSSVQKNVNVEASTGTGILLGRVLSSEGNKPIAGARVFVRGTTVDIRTDANGRFKATVPSGKSLSISVVHSAYSAQTVGGIRVKANGTTSKTVKLTPASMELEEFVVLAPKVEGSITDIIQEEKKINAIANIIGSEEFSKKGDSSAASALKRVTGVTLIGGKDIFVRGLGGRYSNIEMNSMPLPSPDPTKRSVPLDIFPASAIGSMKIQKSATADIPANFGGGYIDIRTKDTVDEDFMKITFGIAGNTNTGDSVGSYTGSSSDWLGFDDGYRDIPADILNGSEVVVGERIRSFSTSYGFTKEELSSYIKALTQSRSLNPVQESLPIAPSVSIEGAKVYKIDDEQTLSVYANYSYSQDHQFQSEIGSSYRFKKDENGQYVVNGDFPFEFDVNRTTSSYSQDGMLNLNYSFLDILKLRYTKLYTHTGEKRTRVFQGGLGTNKDVQDARQYYYDWDERTLNVDQLQAIIKYELFNHDSELDMGLGHATATLNQPGNYFLGYVISRLGNNREPRFETQTQIGEFTKLKSDDTVKSVYIKNKTNIEIFNEKDYFESGISYSSKDRVSRFRRYGIKKDGTINNEDIINTPLPDDFYDTYAPEDPTAPNALRVSNLFQSAYDFDAVVNDMEIYVNTLLNPRDDIEVLFGLRYVDLTQQAFQYEVDRNDDNKIVRTSQEIDIKGLYPSASIKYTYDEKNQFDAAISRTYIIPDLREFTEGEYADPYRIAKIKGNNLLENTDIYSFDLKYTYSFSSSENIKLGTFYKYLDKPIEDTQKLSSSIPLYTFFNPKSATVYGIEIDGRKNLDFIDENMKNYYISGNFAYMSSTVTLDENTTLQGEKAVFTNQNRQLQGLSQTVVNLTLGYENQNRSVALSYNKMGERIRKVGLVEDGDKPNPDTIEVPPHLLDLTWIEKMGNYSFKLKLKNILDSKVQWLYGDLPVKEYKTGQEFSLSASYKF